MKSFYRWNYSVGVELTVGWGVIVGAAGGEGEDNDRFNKKPTIIPMSATKSANLKENPGSLFLFLRLFNISCKGVKHSNWKLSLAIFQVEYFQFNGAGFVLVMHELQFNYTSIILTDTVNEDNKLSD